MSVRRSRGAVVARATLISLAIVMLAFPAAAVIGGLFPTLPVLGRFGVFLTTSLPVILLGAAVPVLLAVIALRLGGGRGTRLLTIMAGAVLLGGVVETAQMMVVASDHGASFSPLRQLGSTPVVRTPERLVIATVDGVELHADLWSSFRRLEDPQPGPALVFVHGGAFVGGSLGSRPWLFELLANAGYTVIDVEYRLAPPPRWHDAPADVLCALAWLAAEAPTLGIDPARVTLMGESAGGSLALVAGYAAGTSAIEPSCAGDPLVPAGVVGIAPAADLAGIWSDGTLVAADLPFPEAYVGGPPSAFPERYEAAAPFALLRSGLPPTLIVAASADHLVRLERVTSIVDGIRASGSRVTFIVLPFADHGFDGPRDGFGAQVLEGVIPSFVEAPAAFRAPGA